MSAPFGAQVVVVVKRGVEARWGVVVVFVPTMPSLESGPLPSPSSSSALARYHAARSAVFNFPPLLADIRSTADLHRWYLAFTKAVVSVLWYLDVVHCLLLKGVLLEL